MATKDYFAIIDSLGTPICIDSSSCEPTFDRSFGHFVRVLMDMGLLKDLRYKILVERVSFSFFVDIEYKKLPKFYKYCKAIGHSFRICRKKNANLEEANKPKARKDNQKIYVPLVNKAIKRNVGEKEQDQNGD